jgi:TPP-dependent 2-oxoacid decarboxylase
LRTVLRTSRPVYLAIPADVAGAPVPGPAAPLRTDQPTEADPLAANMFAGRARPVPASAGSQAAGLTRRGLCARVRDFLLPGDLVVADQGTAFYDAAEVALPEATRVIGQPMWASAGWALPAALGASLAEPSRRVVLITGDGAMQQTAAELGTLLAQGLTLVMIVISKGGYATERLIGPDDAPPLLRDLTRETGADGHSLSNDYSLR